MRILRDRQTILLGRYSINVIKPNDQDRFEGSFQSEAFPACRKCPSGLDISHTAQERQREASLAWHDGDRRDDQWHRFSRHAPARRSEESLAKSGPESI